MKAKNGKLPILYDIELFLIYCFILAFLFRDLNFTRTWAYGDLNPFSREFVNWFLYSWIDEGLGYPYVSQNYLGLLFQIILILLLGENWAQKTVIILPFILSYSSLYFLLRKFDFSKIISFLGGLFYSINPITMAAFVGGGFGQLMTYSIFPLFFYFAFKFLVDGSIRHLFISTSLSLFFWNSYCIFWMVVLVFTCLAATLLTFKKIELETLIIRTLLMGVLILLIFAPTVVQLMRLSERISAGKISFESEARYCYRDILLYNIIRLAGNTGSPQTALGYNCLSYYTCVGYVIAFMVVLSMLFIETKSNRMKSMLLITSLLSFIIITGMLTLIRSYPHFVDLFPIFSTLRNPEKLMYPLAFSYTILFAYGTRFLITKFDRNRMTKKGIAVILLFLILIYNVPALDGTLGLQKIRGDNYVIEEKYHKLPKILQTIDENYKEYRVLILPWEYTTNLKIRGILPNYFGTRFGAQIIDISTSEVEKIFEAINLNSINKHQLLSLFNVKYVVIDKTFSISASRVRPRKLIEIYGSTVFYEFYSYWLTGFPSYFYSLFNEDQNFELVYEDDNFAIFKNLALAVPQKIYAIFDNKENYNLTLSYSLISRNLVMNPSFEEGINDWKAWPGGLVNVIKENNNCYIAIYGQEKWWTIIYQTIPVEGSTLYQLNFSIKVYNMTDAHVKVLWYNQTEQLREGDAFGVNYIKLHERNLTEGQWYNISEIFRSPKDAKMARIQFLGSTLKNYTSTVTCIDNISFYKVLPRVTGLPQIYNVVKYEKVNPTFWKIKINTTKPFILAFAVSYNPLWEVSVYKHEKIVEKVRSIPLYGMINAFWINTTGELELMISYKPQDWFKKGLVVSQITFFVCVIYVFYDWIKDKNSNLAKNLKEKMRRVKSIS